MAATLSSILPTAQDADVIPPLQNGDRLTRDEFERRYSAMPHVKKAELIEGIVYMPSPVSTLHSEPHADVLGWLSYYRMLTPGLRCGDNGTLRLDMDNEPQPDAYVMIPGEAGGSAQVDEDNYVSGAPELVVEVAASSVSIDLHGKLNAYRRNGVKEYVVWRVRDRAIDWFVLRGGDYVAQQLDGDGIYHSAALPGLALNAGALIAGDLRAVADAVDQACAAPAHAEFVARLAATQTAAQ